MLGGGLAINCGSRQRDEGEAHPDCDDGTNHRCCRARSNLHSSLASTRKCDQRLFTAARIGHQPRVCENASGKLGGSQATSPLAATPEPRAAMGAECWQTRKASQ